MPNIRRHKRTASAGLISVVLHLLLALLVGMQLNWRFHRPVVPPEVAIQVAFYQGDTAPPMRARNVERSDVRTFNESVNPPTRIPQPASRVPLVAAAVTGIPTPTEAAIESEASTPLVSPNDLMLSEEGTLSNPAAEAEPSASAEPAVSDAPDAPTEEAPGPTIEEQMHDAIRGVTSQIVAGNGSGHVDVVFLLDTSGSMYDNILAVSQELSFMASTFKQHGLDYRVGLVKFKSSLSSLRIFPMTTDVTRFQRVLRNTTQVGGPERAYDAIIEAAKRVHFREGVDRHFVLVTDEPLSGSYTHSDVWQRCQEAGIHVSVIGLRNVFHRKLAEVTGGTWQPIPVSP